MIRDNTLKLLNNKECYNIDFNYLRLRTGKNVYDIRDMNLNELIEKKERIWCEYHNRCSFALNKKDRIAKENEIKRVANDCILKGFITKDNRLYKAMINYQVEIAD